MFHWIETLFNKRMPLIPRTDNFQRAIKFILAREGGYVVDNAGPTKYGISQKNHPTLTTQEIKDLTPQEASKIYYSDYWEKAGCDYYEWPLCLVVFDGAVNEGIGGIHKLVEQLKEDTPLQMANQLINLREQAYREIVKNNPKDEVYLQGWLNRLELLRKQIIQGA